MSHDDVIEQLRERRVKNHRFAQRCDIGVAVVLTVVYVFTRLEISLTMTLLMLGVVIIYEILIDAVRAMSAEDLLRYDRALRRLGL